MICKIVTKSSEGEICKVEPLFQIKQPCYHSHVYYISHCHHVKNMYLRKYFLWQEENKILDNMHDAKVLVVD
jgi:hypothetical protein